MQQKLECTWDTGGHEGLDSRVAVDEDEECGMLGKLAVKGGLMDGGCALVCDRSVCWHTCGEVC